ncbi:molybdopterin-binding protein [Clostridiaceae bacterium 35-E11]
MKLLKVDTVKEVEKKMEQHFQCFQVNSEEIHILDALGRVLAENVYSAIDLPEFHRSTVDGYAILSKDTFGVSESLPNFLDIVGKVEMGERTDLCVESGKAVYVPTGGMIPKGADGVVMIEYIEQLDEKTIAVYRPIAPGDGVISKGEDMRKGDVILSKGRRIKPQDIGALSGIGMNSVKVFQKPKVAILSTGDEIVDPKGKIKFGQIRDINTYALSALVMKMGGEVIYKAVIKDDYQTLKRVVEQVIDQSDLVVISGGSSVGVKDVTAKVINDLGDPGVFVHGVAIKPGKPTIIGKAKDTAIFGLPGHPVSALIVFQLFGKHFIDQMLSIGAKNQWIIEAVAGSNIHSSPGKETYQMVRIIEENEQYIAKPIYGKSGAISLITQADGYIKIDTNKEGIQKGEKVRVTIL